MIRKVACDTRNVDDFKKHGGMQGRDNVASKSSVHPAAVHFAAALTATYMMLVVVVVQSGVHLNYKMLFKMP